jgi:hypothetical protein
MKQFKNNYAAGISTPLSQVRNILFAASTAGSAFCLASIAVAFVSPEATIHTNTVLWVFCIIAGLIIASLIDFVIIQRVGRFAVTEVIAWRSQAFYTPTLRKINAVLISCIVAFGLFLSFITSWDGASLASGMAPSFTPKSISLVMNEERKAVNDAVNPYQQAVKNIESKIKETVKAKTSGELSRLAAQGNTWAKSEILKIEQAVNRQYAKELSNAKTALYSAEEREQSRADKVINNTEMEAVRAIETNTKRATVINKILVFVGVLPLIFAFLLLVAECNTFVMLQLPTDQQKPQNQGAAGQRSDAFENMYTNP